MEKTVWFFIDSDDKMILACDSPDGCTQEYAKRIEYNYTKDCVAFDYIDGSPHGYTNQEMIDRIVSGELIVEDYEYE